MACGCTHVWLTSVGGGGIQVCKCADVYGYVVCGCADVFGVCMFELHRSAQSEGAQECHVQVRGYAGVGVCPSSAVPHSAVPQFPYLRINSTPWLWSVR